MIMKEFGLRRTLSILSKLTTAYINQKQNIIISWDEKKLKQPQMGMFRNAKLINFAGW